MSKRLIELAQRGAPLDLVKEAVRNGADVTQDSYAAFRWACRNGHHPIATYLLSLAPSESDCVHAISDYALRFAAENGHIRVVLFLLQRGADGAASNHAPLKKAHAYGHWHVVQALLAACYDDAADVPPEFRSIWQTMKNAVRVIERACAFQFDWVRL